MPRGIYPRKPRDPDKLRSNAASRRIQRVPSEFVQSREGELRQFMLVHAGMVALVAEQLRRIGGNPPDTVTALFDIAEAMRIKAQH